MEVAQVNLPVGVLIWVMIIPMLVKIDFAAMTQVKSQWRGIGVTLFVNWFVKPFSMALLGWIFIRHVFAPWLPADQTRQLYRRLDPAGRRSVHGDGVRLVSTVQGRSVLHAVTSSAQRFDHDRGVCAARRTAAGPIRHHGAVGHADHLGRPVHRHSRHPRASAAQAPACQGRRAFPADGRPSRPVFDLRACSRH